MKQLSLAARYRPQTFAEVAGQDMVKAVLSRAAQLDRPAPAYLLSGTRGVGKTTIARIFAKALNCAHAPAAEPCNTCPQCQKITQGNHVDVAEIDGASNNSVEDARALRENIGYAPMEGRYRVFIIDEAHMLSRAAFNALLKTLEEPPRNVVFVFATTEVHKFPITIVSRCQHFVFRHLTEDALNAHLAAVLGREGIPFEEGAVRLIAKRAAGSVRDSMSLLDQTLALGGDKLDMATTREVLGLAGQEMFEQLFAALHGGDTVQVAEISRQLLARGVDIGFFVRELAANLRNLFLLRQAGAAIVPSLGLAADEQAFATRASQLFTAPHLHAAWQMTLDAQRGIVQSPEPAAALELLLLNLALLPSLLPVGSVVGGGTPQARPRADHRAQAAPAPQPRPAQQANVEQQPEAPQRAEGQAPATPPAQPPVQPQNQPQGVAEAAPQPEAGAGSGPNQQPDQQPDQPKSWEGFCQYCAAELEAGRHAPTIHFLCTWPCEWQPGRIVLRPRGGLMQRQIDKEMRQLQASLTAYWGSPVEIEVIPPKSQAELMETFSQHPALAPCMEVLGARLAHCEQI